MSTQGVVVPAPKALAAYHRSLAALDPTAAPEARALCGPSLSAVRRLVALPGSFNPPHMAHQALLTAARDAWRADAAVYVLSVRTVDKERPSGMLVEDRLWLLCELVQAEWDGMSGAGGTDRAGVGVVATNRGLYVDQAEALHQVCPRLEELAFVTGYDKIVQIFDPRYYDDRDVALEQLFARAAFLVAPREDATQSDLEALLAQPDNVRYSSRVRPLPLPPELAGLSSTRVRRHAAELTPGARVDDHGEVPARVSRFIEETGCYREPAPTAYAERAAAIAAVARAQR